MVARATDVMGGGPRGRARSILHSFTVRLQDHPCGGRQATGLVNIPSTVSFPQLAASTVSSHTECLSLYRVLRACSTTVRWCRISRVRNTESERMSVGRHRLLISMAR